MLARRGVAFGREPDGSIAVDTIEHPQFAFAYKRQKETWSNDDPVDRHDGEAVWGGMLHQFGHFLLDSTSRLWPLLPGNDLEGLPVVFAVGSSTPVVEQWCNWFGVETIALPEKGSIRFTRMFVPERAWQPDAWIAPEMRDIHLHARGGMNPAPEPRRDTLWLSRTRMGRRAPLDESLLEWILADHVTPTHLETMRLDQQIATLESSRAVAGVMGSAFHGLLMTLETPSCLYLCPPWVRNVFVAQHNLLGSGARFAEAVRSEARIPRFRSRNAGVSFPAGHRVVIPDALAALRSALLPELFDDARIAAFASPQRRSFGRLGEVEEAALKVLRDPLNAAARVRLGAIFAEQALTRCAEEQLEFAANLEGRCVRP